MGSVFTPEIQIRILVWFCKEPEECKYWLPYLEPELFEFESLKWIAACIKHSYEEYGNPPTSVMIESDCILTDAEFEEHDKVIYDSFLELLEIGLEEEESAYVADVLPKYIRSRNLRILLHENEEMKDEGDWEGLVNVLKSNEPILNQSDLNLDNLFSISTFAEIFNQGESIPSGIPLIDNPRSIAGLHKKEMMLVLADTNVGKSLLMTYIGGRALEAGFKVLHITLEMSVARTLVRYCATLDPELSVSVGDITGLRNPELLVKYLSRLKEQYDKKLFLYELPTGIGSLSDIERLVDYAEPDLLVLDYLDLIKPPTKRDSKRYEIAELAMVTRGMAVQGNYHILSASQTNRGGHNTKIIDVDMAAEDYDKMRTADDVIGLGADKDTNNKSDVIISIAKARNAPKGQASRYKVDYSHLRFTFVALELTKPTDGFTPANGNKKLTPANNY